VAGLRGDEGIPRALSAGELLSRLDEPTRRGSGVALRGSMGREVCGESPGENEGSLADRAGRGWTSGDEFMIRGDGGRGRGETSVLGQR
jgi:hypothetical protein